MYVQRMNVTPTVYNVITSQWGQQIIASCPPHLVQSLVSIAMSPSMDFPNILKSTMVNIIKLLCEIHQSDSQTINAYQAKASMLQRRLDQAEAQTAACQEVKHQGGQDALALATPPAIATPEQKVATRVERECQISMIGFGTRPYLTRSIDEETQTARKREETCLFYKRGCCRHKSEGIGCQFTHPPTCARYEMYGTQKQLGCRKGKRCKQMHRTICRNFMKKKCTNGKACGYFHPVGLRRKQRGNGPMLDKDEMTHDNDIFWTLVKLMELSVANKSCNVCGFKQ